MSCHQNNPETYNMYHPWSSKKEYMSLYAIFLQLMPYIELTDHELAILPEEKQTFVSDLFDELFRSDFKPIYLLHMTFEEHRLVRKWARDIYLYESYHMPPPRSIMKDKLLRLSVYYHVEYLGHIEWQHDSGVLRRRRWNIFH